MDSSVTHTISLWDALASVPDHRRAEDKRYPLASLLLIAIAAMLAGRRDQLGIVRWGRRLSRETLQAIGFGRDRVPAPSVWCELFQELDVTALEQALGDWVRARRRRATWRLMGSGCAAAPRRKPPGHISWRRSVPVCKVSSASYGSIPTPMRSPPR